MSAGPSALVPQLEIARVLRTHKSQVNSLDFSKDGELLLSSGEDQRVCLYSTTAGATQRTALCSAHGAMLARFTHDPMSIIVASPSEHTIRYMSLHDNKYLRTFRAHTDHIVALEMSPKEDFFASASMDGTARIWDLRTTNCQGLLRFEARGQRPAVAFDPQGLVFSAAVAGGQIKLFDVRAYDKGPFCTFTPDLGGSKSFSCIKFSNDGKLMLLTTTQGGIVLLDAYNGAVQRIFTGHSNEQGMPLEACFSPDAESVIAGGEDGVITLWQTGTGQQIGMLRAHTAPVAAVKWNPTRMMAASACSQVCLWLPLS